MRNRVSKVFVNQAGMFLRITYVDMTRSKQPDIADFTPDIDQATVITNARHKLDWKNAVYSDGTKVCLDDLTGIPAYETKVVKLGIP